MRYSKNTVLIGLRFNRYVITAEAGFKGRARMVKAICDCGTEKIVDFGSIRSGTTKSCGCYKIDNMGTYAIKHGLWTHPLYNIWHGIKGRCLNKKSPAYKYYGGRKITVHKEWINDFKAFYDWCMGNGWQKGLQLDRRDNDKGYCPDNCRFITSKQNNRNKRGNRFIEFNGLKKTISEWAEITGLKYSCIWGRQSRGLPIEEIFSQTPLFRPNKGSFKPGKKKH